MVCLVQVRPKHSARNVGNKIIGGFIKLKYKIIQKTILGDSNHWHKDTILQGRTEGNADNIYKSRITREEATGGNTAYTNLTDGNTHETEDYQNKTRSTNTDTETKVHGPDTETYTKTRQTEEAKERNTEPNFESDRYQMIFNI